MTTLSRAELAGVNLSPQETQLLDGDTEMRAELEMREYEAESMAAWWRNKAVGSWAAKATDIDAYAEWSAKLAVIRYRLKLLPPQTE